MMNYLKKERNSLTYRIVSAVVLFTFSFSMVTPPAAMAAPMASKGVYGLPAAGAMVDPTGSFVPAIIKGLTVDPQNPLHFDFIVDTGDSRLEGVALTDESKKMIKYFLATLTTPENELWVNLSPYEKDKIMPDHFSQTELGMDLLAQDYMLKQLTASLMYPEKQLGSEFWKRVNTKAKQLYGTTEIPLNTFNKIWIVPEKAVVYQTGTSAYVVDSHLKVMLEKDYLTMSKNLKNDQIGTEKMAAGDVDKINGLSSDVVREVLIPEIEQEVNQGQTFAQLRQIYNSVILANWYKDNLKETLLSQVYVNQNKNKGVDTSDKELKQKIYDQYVAAFQKGVYNYIKEDYDPEAQKKTYRKYFSGGINLRATDLGVGGVARTITDQDRISSPAIQQQLTAAFSSPADFRNVGVDLMEYSPNNVREVMVRTPNTRLSSPVMPDDIAKEFMALENDQNLGEGVARNFRASYEDMLAMVPYLAAVTNRSEKDILQELQQDTYVNFAKQLATMAALRENGEIFPQDVQVKVSESERQKEFKPAKLPGNRRARILFWPMKGDPWQSGHIWMLLESIAQFKIDKTVVFIDNGDPTRKPDLTSLSLREALTMAVIRYFLKDYVEFTPISRENPALWEADGETALFYQMELNGGLPADWYYGGGSDHANLYAPKKRALSKETLNETLTILSEEDAAKAAEIKEDLRRSGLLDEKGSFNDRKVQALIRHLRRVKYLETTNPDKIDFPTAKFKSYGIQGNPGDLALDDLKEVGLDTENGRLFVYRAMYDLDIPTKIRTNMTRDLAGYKERQDRQSIKVIFSVRKGAEGDIGLKNDFEAIVNKQLEKAGLPSMALLSINQPIDASATDVRKHGLVWKVPFPVLQAMADLGFWGFNTEASEGIQKMLVKDITDYMDAYANGQARPQDFLEIIRGKITKLNGFGLNEFDRTVMGQIASNTRKLKEGRDDGLKAATELLGQIRVLIFARAQEIVDQSFNNPLPAKKGNQQQLAQMIRLGMVTLPPKTSEYFQALEQNLRQKQEPGKSLTDIAKEFGVSDDLFEAARIEALIKAKEKAQARVAELNANMQRLRSKRNEANADVRAIQSEILQNQKERSELQKEVTQYLSVELTDYLNKILVPRIGLLKTELAKLAARADEEAMKKYNETKQKLVMEQKWMDYVKAASSSPVSATSPATATATEVSAAQVRKGVDALISEAGDIIRTYSLMPASTEISTAQRNAMVLLYDRAVKLVAEMEATLAFANHQAGIMGLSEAKEYGQQAERLSRTIENLKSVIKATAPSSSPATAAVERLSPLVQAQWLVGNYVDAVKGLPNEVDDFISRGATDEEIAQLQKKAEEYSVGIAVTRDYCDFQSTKKETTKEDSEAYKKLARSLSESLVVLEPLAGRVSKLQARASSPATQTTDPLFANAQSIESQATDVVTRFDNPALRSTAIAQANNLIIQIGITIAAMYQKEDPDAYDVWVRTLDLLREDLRSKRDAAAQAVGISVSSPVSSAAEYVAKQRDTASLVGRMSKEYQYPALMGRSDTTLNFYFTHNGVSHTLIIEAAFLKKSAPTVRLKRSAGDKQEEVFSGGLYASQNPAAEIYRYWDDTKTNDGARKQVIQAALDGVSRELSYLADLMQRDIGPRPVPTVPVQSDAQLVRAMSRGPVRVADSSTMENVLAETGKATIPTIVIDFNFQDGSYKMVVRANSLLEGRPENVRLVDEQGQEMFQGPLAADISAQISKAWQADSGKARLTRLEGYLGRALSAVVDELAKSPSSPVNATDVTRVFSGIVSGFEAIPGSERTRRDHLVDAYKDPTHPLRLAMSRIGLEISFRTVLQQEKRVSIETFTLFGRIVGLQFVMTPGATVENLLAEFKVMAQAASSPVGQWERWAQATVAPAELDLDMFRDYDYRIVGEGKVLKPEMVFRLGLVWADMAIDKAQKAGIETRRVLVARDGRKIEPELVDAIVAALRYRGLDVLYSALEGPNAVTSYSWAAQELKPLMSIFITASHVSEKESVLVRGFKVAMLKEKGGNIQSLSTQEIKTTSLAAVKNLLAKSALVQEKESAQKGTFTPVNVTENTIRFNTLVGKVAAANGSLYDLGKALRTAENPVDVLAQFEKQYDGVTEPLKGMKIVVEGSHTQSGQLATDTFRRLGAEVVLLHGDIQEVSGRHKADPAVEVNRLDLEQAIKETGADFGMAFDLDGDRGYLDVPVRSATSADVQFEGVAPDNAIVTLLPFLINQWGYGQAGVKLGVIRDVLGTHGVNDVAGEKDVEFYQTDAGYVFLKKVKEAEEKKGYVIPIYGERSGHTWLHASGEIENPLAVAVLFATLVKQQQRGLFQDRVAGVQKEGATLNPVLDVYRATTKPYSQSPRFQPFFHPALLTELSTDSNNKTGWKYDAEKPVKPPQAIIALGRDNAIKRLQAEFTPGKTYDTPSGALTVDKFDSYKDSPEEGGLFRYADIVFTSQGQFVGRFVFRASSNDPSFVTSYEAPMREGQSQRDADRMRQSVAGLVLDFVTTQKIAIVTSKDMAEAMPTVSEKDRAVMFSKANLPFVENDYNAFLTAQGRPGILSSPVEEVAVNAEIDLEEGSLFDVSSPTAETALATAERGGIDFSSPLLNLQIKRDDNGVPLPLPQQPANLNVQIEGFIPVIINVTPIPNLPQLLGLTPPLATDEDEYSFNGGYQDLFDRQEYADEATRLALKEE
jgi:phosphomannomutase